MNRSLTSIHLTCGLRVQQARQRASLSRAALSALSGVDWRVIRAVENDTLCQSISVHEIQHAVLAFNGRGPQHLMRRTLARWSDDLHRLADALADNFENLFPTAELADLSDQLWLKIQRMQPQPASLENPWHDWGWYRNVALSDDLSDDTLDDQYTVCELRPVIRELLAGLEPCEQIVIALRYGLDGPTYTLAEIGWHLGLTRQRVSQIEQRALAYLRHPKRSRRLRGYLK
jgi:RNA polymerase sigma factor (sigma-70 family)